MEKLKCKYEELRGIAMQTVILQNREKINEIIEYINQNDKVKFVGKSQADFDKEGD
ncbi:MAG TPA: hypothetical protein VIK86_04720 [Candidatus Paceibacterota bacterium]